MKLRFDSVGIWLASIIALIVGMVCIGGITRLTGSGLSITEWNPIMGAIPPLNEEAWQAAFLKYQHIPQFKILNSQMALNDFKFIFFWEYLHRLVGRLIGLVILVPGAILIARKQLDRDLIKKVALGLALGGMQGFLGWFMVKSGLSELVYVSHLRLAAHLLLALFILAYWTRLFLQWANKSHYLNAGVSANQNIQSFSVLRRRRWPVFGVVLLLGLQLTYGAFLAGLKGGFAFNTFPKMNADWIPSTLFSLTPVSLNWVSNPVTVQFIHRWLAVLLVFWSVGTAVYLQRVLPRSSQSRVGVWFLGGLFLQFCLGVATLVFQVPLVLASLHQLNGCLLVFLVTCWVVALGEPNVEPMVGRIMTPGLKPISGSQ